MLDGFQAGLSWITILRKRDAFRRAFAGFDPERVAGFGEAEVAALLADAGIVRSRAKIEATVGNARAFLAMRDRGEDFSAFCWEAVGGRVRQNAWRAGEVPTETAESRALSKALKARGFKFVGPVIVYAWMEATGLVNDHLVTCFRHAELGGPPRPEPAPSPRALRRRGSLPSAAVPCFGARRGRRVGGPPPAVQERTMANTSFPDSAVVYILDDIPGVGEFQGTGVVIGPHSILTAAHLVYDADTAPPPTPSASTPASRRHDGLQPPGRPRRPPVDPHDQGRGRRRRAVGPGDAVRLRRHRHVGRPVRLRVLRARPELHVRRRGREGLSRPRAAARLAGAEGTVAQHGALSDIDTSALPLSPGYSGGPLYDTVERGGGDVSAVVGTVSTSATP